MTDWDDLATQMASNTQAPAPASKFDAAADALASADTTQRAQAALAVGFAADQKPDTAAFNVKLARRYGTSPEVIAKFPDEFKQRMLVQITRDALQGAPTLQAQIASDPAGVAPVIHDDVPTLSAMDRLMQGYRQLPGQYPVEKLAGGASNLVGALDEPVRRAFYGMPMAALKGLGGLWNSAATNVNLLLGAFPAMGYYLTGNPDAMDRYFANMVDASKTRQSYFDVTPETPFPEKAAHTVGSLLGVLSQIMLTGTGGQAPAAAETAAQAVTQAVEHGVKAMTFPALNDAVSTGRKVYEQTGDPKAAARAAQSQYVATTLGGVLPLNAGGGAASRILQGFVSGAVGGEAGRQIVNWGMPQDMQTPGSVEDLILSGLGGSILGLGGGHNVEHDQLHDAIRKTYTDALRAETADKTFDTLNTMSQLAAASKWRERDPEGFRRFVEAATEDGRLPDVYVDGQVFNQALVRNGVNADQVREQMPGVASQMQEALQTDGYVRIPVADYATNIAGTKLDADLLPHLKSDPLGPSHAEAQQFWQGEAERMQDTVRQLSERATEQDAFRTSQEAVINRIQQQLDALNRFPSPVNKVYSTIQGAILSRIAQREGITPEQALDKYGAHTTAANLADGRAFRQQAGDQLRQLVDLTAAPTNENRVVELGHVGDAEAALAREHAGLNIEGFKHTADLYAVRHILSRHGNAEAEAKHGALAVTREDIAALPEVVAAPDATAYGIKNRRGQDLIASVKRMPDGSLLVVEEVRTGRHTLSLASARKVPAATDVRSLLSNVRGDGGVAPIIVERGQLGQQQDANARGGYAPATRTISLLEHADLSTFLHETGHWALDTYMRIAEGAPADGWIHGEVGSLLKWFGVKDLAAWHAMSMDEQRPFHEQFARAFESYLMEGKAPAAELRGVFSRIRSWMLSVYQSLRNLNVTLSPEVRGVFDRMLASDEAIRQAEAARAFQPVLDAKPAGVSDADWASYLELGREATNDAIDDLQAKSLRDMKWLNGAQGRALREKQKEANTHRKAIRAEVERDVDKEPIYRAERWLTRGEMVDDDGNAVATSPEARKGAKLNSERLNELFPEGSLDRPDMDALHGMTGPHGLDPDMVAEMFGFRSGEDLVRQLAARDPREQVVDGLTEKRMLEEHGELANPADVRDAAAAAVHNEARARFMATGLKLLAKSPVSARVLLNGAREAAEAAVGDKRVRDLNVRQYEAAETKTGRAALKAAPKDPKLAVVAQRAALLNNQLVKATQKAIVDVQRGVEYLKRYSKDSVRERIDVAFRDQIDQLLAKYDLRQSLTPEQAAAKRVQSLDAFVEKLAAMKFNIDVPESLLADVRRTHYKDLTVAEFRGLVDTVRALDHIGRETQRVTDGTKSRLLKEVADEAVQQTESLQKTRKETNRGLSIIAEKWIKTKAFGRSIQASLLKMEQMVDWLDNYNPNGVFNRMVFRKIADAEAARNDLDKAITAKWEAFVKAVPKDLLKANRGTVEVPGVIDKLTGETQRLTWGEKIALAGIRGDATHFAKLLKGEGWDANAVLDFLDRNMAKEEWDFVRGLASTFQDLFPLKAKMLRDLGGSAPKEVARVPFATRHGDMPGWYWPITYDPARSQSVKERNARHEASLFEDNIFNRADTSTGREMTRNENYAKPMLLSIDVLPRVLKDEIRDITTRKAIIEADRFLSHPDVRKAVTGALSEQHYDTFNGWLLSLANDAAVRPNELQMWDRLAHEIRTRVTMVGLGFRLSTMFMHGMTAAGESIAEAGPKAMAKGTFNSKTLAALTTLGPEWMEKGIANFIRSNQFEANRDFIFERSAEMRHRSNEIERDVREQLRNIHLQLMDPATGTLARAKLIVESRAYQGIAMLDMASALPTWMGGYLKGITPEAKGGLGMSEADAVYFADKTVRNAHGGGGIKDMAAVQRGGEWFKLFTMFYTFWNHNINRIMDTARRIGRMPDTFADAQATGDWGKFRGDVGTLILRTFMYTLGVQAVHHLIHPPKQDDRNPEGWLAWFGKAMAASAFGGVPLARDVIAHYTGGQDYEVSPIASAVNNTDMLLKDVQGKSVADHWIKHALNEAGYILGAPLGQAASSAQFLADVWNGRQHPQQIAEWWRGITTGDMHKH